MGHSRIEPAGNSSLMDASGQAHSPKKDIDPVGGPPISAAFVSPGWPPEAFTNGIIPYIADVVETMNRAGHRAMILTQRLALEAAVDDAVVRSIEHLPVRRG